MSERAALILLDGEIPNAALVRAAGRRCSAIICADGGLRHSAKLKVKPDFVVGDMDSLPRPLPRVKGLTYWCDFDENRSDFEKALDFAAGVGCETAYVAGAFGGATDHVLVNLGTAQRRSESMELVLLDHGVARMLGPGRHTLAPGRKRFSLLAAPRAVVTLKNAQYPLSKFELLPGSRGLGNAARGIPALTIHEGAVWLISAP